jgi:hypothetical protein
MTASSGTQTTANPSTERDLKRALAMALARLVGLA